MKKRLLLALTGAAAMACASSALAHHSFAMFDATKVMVLDGTITQFQFTNPHSWVEVDVPTAAGVKHWSLELNNLVGLRRQGWRAKSLVPGDKVKITMHPMRDGSSAGQMMTVVTADGKTLYGNGGPPGQREGAPPPVN